MSEPLLRALARLAPLILDDETLVRAVASGRRRGTQPPWRRVELRYVDLKAGRHLQVTAYDDAQAHTSNHAVGDAARDGGRRPARPAVRQLARRHHHRDPPAPGHQEGRGGRAHPRPAGRPGRADPRPRPRQGPAAAPRTTRSSGRSGLSDHEGRMKPSRQSKYRQVEEFLRILDASIADALDKGHLRTPDAPSEPLADRRPRLRQRLPDLRHRALPDPRARPAGAPDRHRPARAVARAQRGDRPRARRRRDLRRLVDRRRPTPAVRSPTWCSPCTPATRRPTTRWRGPSSGRTPLILAAPCCHHDIAAQLRRAPTPAPYAMLTRHGILRERFADTLTDGLRASLLRLAGLPRRRHAVRRQRAHAAQHAAPRPSAPGGR